MTFPLHTAIDTEMKCCSLAEIQASRRVKQIFLVLARQGKRHHTLQSTEWHLQAGDKAPWVICRL